ncbi:RabGAP/TBC [Yamadazyma tenuis ATCC 10573]|uniref:RabGAP/TBC n=1 Tax=Candida tenuis (strain ATCC 10573 / BCRC 21748 / CBS 615 / JCM 9827 / NBRC 10315 / NRRL Y-1498 / VKM Y-70) TaxID=590646 RepID=G3B5U7_CANTC|nr:RabGAP/TBC [Yamadazyma tenuis ATCC 10573]EGV63307.1 RabGAP/TBC [Yamadazyma tenuis ATCC 10573]
MHQRSESNYSNNYSLLDMYKEDSEDEQNTLNTSKLDSINQQTTKEILNGDFDRYGFKKVSVHSSITNETYNDWFKEYAEFLKERKTKWVMLLKSNGLQVDSEKTIPSRFPPKSDKVKKLIRKGIPGEWRGSAWFFYAGGYEKLNKHVGVYDKIVRDTKNLQNKDTDVIERDLNRTFPDNIYFNGSLRSNQDGTPGKQKPQSQEEEKNSSPMIRSLRRVLVAFAHYQPQIGYCQSLNFLAGLLLLFMSEERSFWLLVILTERIIPKVHSKNLEGVHTDQGVLMLCIKEYIPSLWSILGKTFEGEVLSEDKILTKLPPVTLVTSSWFMSVFVGVLPIESVLRIWDILWYEGSKTIFRFALTLCKTCLESEEFQNAKPRKKNTELEQVELFQFMQSFPKTLINPNVLVDNCFKKIGGYGYGSISQDEINKCREFVAKQRQKLKNKSNSVINPEMNAQERRLLTGDDDIHDVYGFNRSIMSGVAWNNNISNKMKKRFSRKASKSSLV